MGEADLPGSDDADAITYTQIHAAGMRHADTRIGGTQLHDCGDGLLDGQCYHLHTIQILGTKR